LANSHFIAPDVPLSQEELHAVLNHHIISNQEPTSGEQAAHHQPNPSSYGLTWEDFGLRSDYLGKRNDDSSDIFKCKIFIY
jgi:hypothetical protein